MGEIPGKEKVFFDCSNYKEIDFMLLTLNLTDLEQIFIPEIKR